MIHKSILITLFSLLVISCGQKDKSKVYEHADDLVFVNLKGQEVKLSDYQGRRVLVNYWATWCQPCIKEFPSMVKAKDILVEEGYVFLFPTTDSRATIAEFKEKMDIDLEFLRMDMPLTALNIYALPATFVYDSEGKLHQRIDGATDWSSDEMIHTLKQVP